MRGERRQHFESNFNESTLIASRLIAENGTVFRAGPTAVGKPDGDKQAWPSSADIAYLGSSGTYPKASSGDSAGIAVKGGGHQPGLPAVVRADGDSGGALRLVSSFALRPGSTLQGLRCSFEVVSKSVYSVHSPPPILVTGIYLVKLSQLDDRYQVMFTDLSRADSASFPSGVPDRFEAPAFRNIFNDQFATAEFMISDPDSLETQAMLPELIQTMEVVGDDELNLTYDEWVYLVTGWYPKNNKSQRLASRARRMGLAWTQLLTAGADADAAVDAYGKWVAKHDYGLDRNIIAIEPTFLFFVAGLWETPNSDKIYEMDQVASRQRGRYIDASANGFYLDRGAPYAYNLFRNASAWIADPLEDDAMGDIGTRNTVNYWLNGEVRMTRDYDPTKLMVKSGSLYAEREPTEGDEAFLCDVNFHCGTATLQDFPST